ncbi:MAG: LysR family transcriptional regulator [Brevundimonas sp.]|jgi:DNA-binding transcriptional LysR family regulator|nr:LysR family transcriptional regulator [Brevundimonas sp.]
MPSLNWSLLQSFAAVVEAGSLAGAARKTGGSQPTMSRHMGMLEAALGVQLFDRTGVGLILTPTGVALYEEAKRMGDASKRIALSAAGQSEAIAGTIRISASETMAAWVLPSILTSLNQVEPEIAIELVSSDQTSNLLMREADIALRMFRPSQTELIARKVGSVKLGMYASRDYIARHGAPTSVADIVNHVLMSEDLQNDTLEGYRSEGINITRDGFSFRCDSRIVQWKMVLAGFGIGFIQTDVGDREPNAVRIFPEKTIAELPVWLTSHAQLRTSRRVRRVFDFIADELMQRYQS